MTQAEAAFSAEAADRSEHLFRRRLLTALGVALVSLLALAVVAFALYGRLQSAGVWVQHTYAAQNRISVLATEVERLETARRGYLLSPRDSYWRTYVESRAKIRPQADDLADFTSDNPVQVRNSATLRPLIEAKFVQLRATIELAHDGDPEGARRNFLLMQEQNVTQRLRAVFAAMLDEESTLLEQRGGEQRASAFELLAAVLVVSALLTAIAVTTVILMRRYAADLARSQTALRSLNFGLEEAVRDRTADLQRVNEEVQRFAYIVSHDLRSPLVNIMGFTSELETAAKPLGELLERAEASAPGIVTPQMRLAVREDLPESLAFIRTSTNKMDRLINAILQLARQGRRTLTPEPLDMDALAGSVADSLTILAQDKGAEITVEPGMPVLVSDRVAMEQVLSNLVENAVKYLQPGRPGRVVVRGRDSGGRTLLEVEDNGRGVAPADRERIFELFRRAGAQDQPGEGIGLAHVRALVYRLGGTITCLSEPGAGSTFRVSLPPGMAAGQEHI